MGGCLDQVEIMLNSVGYFLHLAAALPALVADDEAFTFVVLQRLQVIEGQGKGQKLLDQVNVTWPVS